MPLPGIPDPKPILESDHGYLNEVHGRDEGPLSAYDLFLELGTWVMEKQEDGSFKLDPHEVERMKRAPVLITDGDVHEWRVVKSAGRSCISPEPMLHTMSYPEFKEMYPRWM